MKFWEILTEAELNQDKKNEISAYIIDQKNSGVKSIPTSQLMDAFDLDKVEDLPDLQNFLSTEFNGQVENCDQNNISLKSGTMPNLPASANTAEQQKSEISNIAKNQAKRSLGI